MIGRWGYSRNEESYSGDEETKEAVIAEAKGSGETHFWIGQYKQVKPQICAQSLCEQLGEWAFEECGEACEGWLALSKEDELDLNKLLNDTFWKWAEENGHNPWFYSVENVEEINIEGAK